MRWKISLQQGSTQTNKNGKWGLRRSGRSGVEWALPDQVWEVMLVLEEAVVDSMHFQLHHKCTERGAYLRSLVCFRE